MIEYPEAVRLAAQFNQFVKGRQVQTVMRGNAPHKFAFYSGTQEEYQQRLGGQVVGEAWADGTSLFVRMSPELIQVFGEGGERILLHRDESTLPKKHQYLWHFSDNTYLTVTIQMWGGLQVYTPAEIAAHPYLGRKGIAPDQPGFTYEYFYDLFESLPAGCADSVKFFVISKPGIWGVANGYLQDILFKAGLHPRVRAQLLTMAERKKLYDATRAVITQAVAQGGRDSEIDLFGQPGGYKRILDSKAAGQPCPQCGTPIEKIQFLGGASYFCPKCQTV